MMKTSLKKVQNSLIKIGSRSRCTTHSMVVIRLKLKRRVFLRTQPSLHQLRHPLQPTGLQRKRSKSAERACPIPAQARVSSTSAARIDTAAPVHQQRRKHSRRRASRYKTTKMKLMFFKMIIACRSLSSEHNLYEEV